MNYKAINEAILNDMDIDSSKVEKTDEFYKYLFNNKVAYYYSKYLSKNKTDYEKRIIKTGDRLNSKYLKTLKLLVQVCKKNHIEFLLYKTHKYIPEVVDGDIDIFVRRKDFYKFLEVFKTEGFEVEEDEPGKGKCVKKSFCVIEPHINISWRGIVYINEDNIWNQSVPIRLNHLLINNCSPSIEMLSICGELFFSPEYIDLYTIKKMNQLVNKKIHITGNELFNGFQNIIKKSKPIFVNSKLPYFISTMNLIKIIYPNVQIQDLIEINFKNLYWKHRYRLNNKLPFAHEWKF